jgi:hypothetical protein
VYAAVVLRNFLVLTALAGCGAGNAPDLRGLTDRVAAVGQELVIELDGTDADGDALEYGVRADISLDNHATMTKTPAGAGLFRWTPTASDVGVHTLDFTVSDGDNDTTVSISVDVRATSGGQPVFRQPLGSGRVVDLGATPCVMVDIVVEDSDSTDVTIAEAEPLIEGAMFNQIDGTTASWKWCPSPAQIAQTDRWTLSLSADDGENAKQLKNYVIVLGGRSMTGPALVINEVDYDNIGTDNAEYIELVNTSMQPATLAGLKLVLVNGGTGAAYSTIDLAGAGSLAAGQFLVVANAGVSANAQAKKLDPLWTQDEIQNGSPDGVALIDDVTHTLIDALAYEGAITAATLPGFPAPVSLVEGTALDAAIADSNTISGALCRMPSGQDTGDANTDWRFCTIRTVGSANKP